MPLEGEGDWRAEGILGRCSRYVGAHDQAVSRLSKRVLCWLGEALDVVR